MKKIISVVAVASLFAAGSAMASGYRIPEQSLDSTAKAGANIASADKADAAYFNPAGMSFLEDAWQVEIAATYLHLSSIDYDDNLSSQRDGSSETENFFLPTMFVVSPDYNDFRFGFSVTAPYGLAKRWESGFARLSAEKFSLKVIELNPTVSYKINNMISIAGGVRMLYNQATVMSNGVDVGYPALTRWVNGDTIEWGYNLGIDIKPSDDWNFALTYRSHVDIDFEGDVQISAIPGTYDGEVTVPAPAVLALSGAYTYDRWTFELTIDETFWSEYEDLDFNYSNLNLLSWDSTGMLYYAYDVAKIKNWDDTTAIRLGVEYKLDEKITLMGGLAYDENPVPEEYAGFELPDSDAWLFSVGVRYKHSDKLEYGLAVLYDYKEERDIVQGYDSTDINGEFSNASALLVSAGLSYKF